MKELYEEYLKNLPSEEQNYIINRVINQIEWYDKKATEKQKRYKILTIIAIILTGVVPILSLFTSTKCGFAFSVIVSICSGTAAVFNSIVMLCAYQKLWIQYRSSCEILKSELFRFLTKAGEYKNIPQEERFDLLVSRSETLLCEEFQTWVHMGHECEKNEMGKK